MHLSKQALFFLLLLFSSEYLSAQKIFKNEIHFKLDNDRFTPQSTDRYYTNGFELGWRKVAKDSAFFINLFSPDTNNFIKVIRRYKINHKIFTPKDITFYLSKRHDRPYASLLSATAGMDFHFKNLTIFKTDFELGVTGPMAMGESLQKWWHKQINVFVPRGWENQIVNSPVVNLNIGFVKQWLNHKIIDFITESHGTLGTIATNIKQSGVVRIGSINTIANSAFTHSIPGSEKASNTTELFLILELAVEYVFYNGLIQGNWLGKKSDYTSEIENWVVHSKFGLHFSNSIFQLSFALNNLSPEIKNGLKHTYATITLGVRF